MPRAGDAFLHGAMPVSHDPSKRINYQPNPLSVDFIGIWTSFVRDKLLDIIYAVTGLNLKSWDAFLNSLHDGKGIDLPNILVNLMTALKGVRAPELPPIPTPEEVLDAFQHIPPINILGITAATIEEDVKSTWDNLVAGFTRIFHPNRSPADLANAATVLGNQADTASQLAEWNNAVLGIRNNKSIMQGIDETEEAVFSIDRLFNSSAPPASIAVTATSWPVSFWRASESAKKGFVSWMGTGITNVTGIYVDVYKLNSSTSTFDLIHSSTNKVGLIAAGTAWTYAVYNIPSADRIQVNAGDVLGFSLRVTGTGTHTVAGASASWFPSHPTVIPAQPAAVITSGGSPASIPFASVTYAGDLAWFGSGIITGDTPPDYFAPRTTQIGDGNSGTYTYDIPTWANYIDVVLVGAGGGGRGGDPGFGRSGDGGFAGSWQGETLVRGTDFPTGATTLSFVVGDGGPGGYYSAGGDGNPTIRAGIPSGKSSLVAAGGAGGTTYNGTRGRSPGNFTFNGITYTGGGTAYTAGGGGNGYGGSAPGGGGGGGSGGTYGIAWAGGGGARGSAWATARQS